MECTTRRCIIKNFIAEYLTVMYDSWGTDREVGMYLLGFEDNMSLDEFKSFILNTYKPEYNDISVIQDKETNKIIGYVNLYKEDSRSKSITIVIEKDSWGHGYGKEVLKKIAEIESKNGLGSLYATCDEHNIAAQHILEAAGFDLIDNIPGERIDLDGNIGDEFLYELEIIRVHYDT
jgi:RimJ/RimL family protein N-acetyltransferase